MAWLVSTAAAIKSGSLSKAQTITMVKYIFRYILFIIFRDRLENPSHTHPAVWSVVHLHILCPFQEADFVVKTLSFSVSKFVLFKFIDSSVLSDNCSLCKFYC